MTTCPRDNFTRNEFSRGNTGALTENTHRARFWVARRIMISAAMLLAIITPVRAEIEFVGILATPQFTRFALSDTTTGKTDWVKRDDNFAGYAVRSYDAKEDTLTLERDGTETRMRLKDDAKIKAARLELTGTITFGATEQIEIERATLLYDQENVFPLTDGMTYRITPSRRSDGTILYKISVERVRDAKTTEKLSAPSIITLPGHQFKIQIGDLGFAFTPR